MIHRISISGLKTKHIQRPNDNYNNTEFDMINPGIAVRR